MSDDRWKLGYMHPEDNILGPITFQHIIDMVYHNCEVRDAMSVKKQAREILNLHIEDFWFLVNNNIDEIVEAATPDCDKNKKLQNHKNWSPEKLEALATEIYQWLKLHDMLVDVCVYYDGKRMSTCGDVNGERVFRYNGEPFMDEADPRDYFEYVAENHILSMSFEGPLYAVLNGHVPGWQKLEAEFRSIFERHGCYFEFGNVWNMTCYEE